MEESLTERSNSELNISSAAHGDNGLAKGDTRNHKFRDKAM